MRVHVIGDNSTAKAIRTTIARDASLVLHRALPAITVEIKEEDVRYPEIDGIDGEAEQTLLRHLGKLSPSGGVLVKLIGGHVFRDDHVALTIPAHNPAEAKAAERAVYRMLLSMARPNSVSLLTSWWRLLGGWRGLAGLLAALVSIGVALWLSGVRLQAQQQVVVTGRDASTRAVVADVADSTDKALRVKCISGCSGGGGGGGGTVDQGTGGLSPWLITFDGAQPVSPTGTWTVTFDGAQAVTQSTSPWVVSFDGAQPVTGPLTDTELRASPVPVSGPLTNAELRASEVPVIFDNRPALGSVTTLSPSYGDGFDEPLSLTESGHLRVDGSEITQPVSIADPVAVTGALTDTELRAIDVKVTLDGETVPVTGTFWQATQPVSLASVPSHAVTNAGTFAVQVDGAALTRLTDIETNTDSGAVVGNGAAATAQRVTLANDSTGIVALTTSSAVIGKLAANSGVDIGDVDVASVSGNVTVVQGTATNLKAQAEAYQGGAAVAAGNPLQVTLANTGANATAVKVDGSAVTQPVSGTFWQATQPVSLASVPSHAVTNAGTFAVQVDGALLTSSQLIDDTVATLGTDTYTEATSKGLVVGAVRRDADTTLVNTTNEVGPLQMDANGRLKVEAFSGETLPVSGTVTVTDGSGALNVIVDSATLGTVTVSDGAGAMNVIVDSGSITASDPTFTDATGTTVPANAAFVAGTDGTNTRALKTDSGGELQVDVLTVPTITVNAHAVTVASGGIASGAVASGAVASGAFASGAVGSGAIASGAVASGAFASGSIASGAIAAGAIATGATSIAAAEDDASANLDTGVKVFAVRKATPANTSGADGDYEAFQISAGRLWTSSTIDAALPAGTNAIGKLAANSGVDIGDVDVLSVAGNVTVVQATATNLKAQAEAYQGGSAVGASNPLVTMGTAVTVATDVTRPGDTTAYAANDAMSNSTSSPTAGGFTFTSACRVSGGSGVITDAIITTSADPATTLQGEIWIFDTSVTNINDNAAFAVSDAEIKTYVGKIPFTLEDSGNNGSYNATNLGMGFTCSGSANLRYLIRVKNAYTPANAEVVTVRLKIIQTN